MDGNFEYSNVIRIGIPLSDAVFTVNPNPFKDVLIVTVQSRTQDKAILVLTDLSGRQQFKRDELLSAGTNTVQIKETGKLAKGTYLITIITSERTQTVKVVKSN
jgi:hypothetical protein